MAPQSTEASPSIPARGLAAQRAESTSPYLPAIEAMWGITPGQPWPCDETRDDRAVARLASRFARLVRRRDERTRLGGKIRSRQ